MIEQILLMLVLLTIFAIRFMRVWDERFVGMFKFLIALIGVATLAVGINNLLIQIPFAFEIADALMMIATLMLTVFTIFLS